MNDLGSETGNAIRGRLYNATERLWARFQRELMHRVWNVIWDRLSTSFWPAEMRIADSFELQDEWED